MGKTTPRRRSGLADALFSSTQKRVLGLLFGQADRQFRTAEIIQLAGSGTGTAHRFLKRLADVGLVSVTRSGNQKLYQAARDSPIFPELQGLVLKTVALADPLREALASRAADIHAAFVYGSVAKGSDSARSDVDLLVISDILHYADVHELLAPVELRIGRTVEPKLMTAAEWERESARGDSFAARIRSGPRLFVLGSADGID